MTTLNFQHFGSSLFPPIATNYISIISILSWTTVYVSECSSKKKYFSDYEGFHYKVMVLFSQSLVLCRYISSFL